MFFFSGFTFFPWFMSFESISAYWRKNYVQGKKKSPVCLPLLNGMGFNAAHLTVAYEAMQLRGLDSGLWSLTSHLCTLQFGASHICYYLEE